MIAKVHREQKRAEALERQEAYVPDPARFGIKQKVKVGLLSPQEALKVVSVGSRTYGWLLGAGQRRYRKAQK